MKRIELAFILLITFLLAACGGQDQDVEPTPAALLPTEGPATTEEPVSAEGPAPTEEPALTDESAPTEAPVSTEIPSPTEAPDAKPLSFESTTYHNDAYGFRIDIPSDWNVFDLGVIGDRGSAVQFQTSATGDGEAAMQLTFYLWDPKDDLDAYVSHRLAAWAASGMVVISQEQLTLGGERQAPSFVVRTQDGLETFFFFTEIGDRYLELSGGEEPELLAEITSTMLFFDAETSSDSSGAELDCQAASNGSAEWVACNVMDGIRSRNLSALHGFMADPFIIGYWGSEGRMASPEEITVELLDYRLPADPTIIPMTFTTDRSQFPTLQGLAVDDLFGPSVAISAVIYSEGWGIDGQGAALIYIAQNDAGDFYWHGLAYSDQHFDS